jgi:hypothetical protein
MLENLRETDISELEREFELEMDNFESEEEYEADEEFEMNDEFEAMSDLEFEGGTEGEYENASGYAERFYELSQRSYESVSELNEEVDGILNEMERDFFWKGAKDFLKKKAKGLVSKGLKYAAGQFPAFKALQGLTQLTRGNLKGFLGSLANAGLAAAIPGGAAILPALRSLGFNQNQDQNEGQSQGGEIEKEAWDNFVEVSREAYEHLAQNLHENADNPLEASRLAHNAFQTGVKKVQARVQAARPRHAGRDGRRRRVVYLGPDEVLVIKRR